MTNNEPIKNIVLLMAMEAEAKVFMDDYGLKEVSINSFKNVPCRAFQGEIHHIENSVDSKSLLTLVINGKDKHHDVDCVGTNGGNYSLQTD